MRWDVRLVAPVCLSLILAACAANAAPQTVAPLIITATPFVPTPTDPPPPTPLPTEAPRSFITYRHPSGVFSISVPDDWEQIDLSTARRLEVRLIPPPGFGSRVLIDGRNEGTRSDEQVRGLIESAVQGYYRQNPAYTELERSEYTGGQMRVTFSFDDGTGAAGRETLYAFYAEPFFVTVRIFLSEPDTPHLALALDTLAASFAIDPQADWGAQVAAINPAELLLTNTYVWQGRDGVTYFMGELYNASPADITNVTIKAGFCDAVGIIIGEATQTVPPLVIRQGAVIPFALSLDDLPEGVTACAASVSAEPATPDPAYTTDIALTVLDLSYHQWRRDLRVQGEINNPTLTPLQDVEILIAAYDADNRVVGYIFFSPDIGGRLNPGQTVPFEIVIPVLAAPPDHLGTLAQGVVFSVENPSLAPTATP